MAFVCLANFIFDRSHAQLFFCCIPLVWQENSAAPTHICICMCSEDIVFVLNTVHSE